METVLTTVTFYFFVFFTSNMEINVLKFTDYDLCMKVVEHTHEMVGKMPDPNQCYSKEEEVSVPILEII